MLQLGRSKVMSRYVVLGLGSCRGNSENLLRDGEAADTWQHKEEGTIKTSVLVDDQSFSKCLNGARSKT